jgi:hypothetical protein
MRKIAYLGPIAAFALVLAGCGVNPPTGASPSQNQAPSPLSEVSSTLASATVPDIKPADRSATAKEVKHFYPTTVNVEKPADLVPNTEGRDFVVTQDLQLQMYLVDKYKPGICYGDPGPIPDEAVSGMIARNPDLSKYLKLRYKLASNLDIYTKIKQLNGVSLKMISGGNYGFDFMDGQCCNMTYYAGTVKITGQVMSDQLNTQEEAKSNCNS